MKKKYILIAVILVVIQFIKPTLNTDRYNEQTDFLAIEKPTEVIAKQIKVSCYNCHSNTTQYPWYNNITPINFLINHHIKEAKSEINFSVWSKYSVKNKIHAIEECIEELEEDEMPLKSYVWLHNEAKISAKSKKELITWLQQLKVKYELIPPPM